MKLRLQEQRFISIEEIQAKSQTVPNTLTPADFNECFQKWQNYWNRCILAQGDYFEGDGGKLILTLSINVITSKFLEILGSTPYSKPYHSNPQHSLS
jgi:hypothetical protein